jgi:hypothetical protein
MMDILKKNCVGLNSRVLVTAERLANLAEVFSRIIQSVSHCKQSSTRNSTQDDQSDCQQLHTCTEHKEKEEINWIYKQKRKLDEEQRDTGYFEPISKQNRGLFIMEVTKLSVSHASTNT